MSEVKTLVTLVLGGVFDHKELGDIDIVYEAPACEALQRELVTDSDDVHVELVSRIDYDAAQSQLAALREELAIGAMLLQQWMENYGALQQRLADAERRNAELGRLLNLADHYLQDQFFNSVGEIVEPNSDDREEVRASIRSSMLAAPLIEQRNETAIELLQMVKDNGGAMEDHEWERIDIALKPTESGASE